MKQLPFLLVAFFTVQITLAQEKIVVQEKSIDDNSIYNIGGIDIKPKYPGGINAFYKIFFKNFMPPEDEKFKGGKLFVAFVIDIDGSMTDMKVIRDIGFGAGEEAIRVLKLCEKWIPGEQNGKKVRVSYVLPITVSSINNNPK